MKVENSSETLTYVIYLNEDEDDDFTTNVASRR